MKYIIPLLALIALCACTSTTTTRLGASKGRTSNLERSLEWYFVPDPNSEEMATKYAAAVIVRSKDGTTATPRFSWYVDNLNFIVDDQVIKFEEEFILIINDATGKPSKMKFPRALVNEFFSTGPSNLSVEAFWRRHIGPKISPTTHKN